jgi:hypothetical protein
MVDRPSGDAAIETSSGQAFAFLGRPAAAPSTLGNEGPNAGGIRGVDQWVDLDTILARALTRFFASWYASAGRQAP